LKRKTTKTRPDLKATPKLTQIPSRDEIDPVQGQIAAKKAMGIEVGVIMDAARSSDPRGRFMKMKMLTTTNILHRKNVAIVFPAGVTTIMEVGTCPSLMVQIMITITIDRLQMDTIKILAIPSIAAVDNRFLITREMDRHLVLVPITAMAPHPENIGGEAGRIRHTGALVLLPGTIRIEIRMGHMGVAHPHHAMTDVNIEIDRSDLHIQEQIETTGDIRAGKRESGLRDKSPPSDKRMPELCVCKVHTLALNCAIFWRGY
jgi:hypothetical protein